METYIFVQKKAAPAATQSDLQSAKAERRGTYTVRHMLARVNWGGIFGGTFGALAAAAIWVPVAYLTRGYWAVGGEIFLIGLAAGLGSWLGGDPRG
mgnify:CR=1 FL=1